MATAELKKHLEHMHGVIAHLNHAEKVKEVFEGRSVWEGTVHSTSRAIQLLIPATRGPLPSKAQKNAAFMRS